MCHQSMYVYINLGSMNMMNILNINIINILFTITNTNRLSSCTLNMLKHMNLRYIYEPQEQFNCSIDFCHTCVSAMETDDQT